MKFSLFAFTKAGLLFFAGVGCGVLVCLWVAQQASEVYVKQQFAVLPHKFFQIGARAVAEGNFVEAEGFVRKELAIGSPEFDSIAVVEKWSLPYPFEAVVVAKTLSSMKIDVSESSTRKSRSLVVARLGYCLEMQAKTVEAEQAYELAARLFGTSPDKMRVAGRDAYLQLGSIPRP